MIQQWADSIIVLAGQQNRRDNGVVIREGEMG